MTPREWTVKRDVFLWSKQMAILNSVFDNPSTAVHSCHNVGKSFDASALASYWIDSHPPGTAFVVTSAPTGDQVKGIIWREIGKLHRNLGLPGRVNLTEWYIGSELVAFGRKPNDYEPTAFQGIHAIYVLVILDEACGIPEELWTAAQSLVSNDDSRIVAIGNPDDPNSHFAKICQPGSGWSVIHIGYQDAPNFTGENVPDIVSRSTLSPAWVEARKQEWGEDSALYTSKILGLFPEDSEFGVVPASWVARCRYLDGPRGEPVHLGVDVGAGGDASVIQERRGPRACRQWKSRHGDPEKLQQEIMDAIEATGCSEVKIDSNGIGWGIAGWVQSRCRDLGLEVMIVPINVGEAANDPARFLNKRAELWWTVGREFSMNKLWDLTGVSDALVAELTAPRYEIQTGKRIKVEKKDEVRKRLGRSPDEADALLLAYADSYSDAESYGTVAAETRIPGVKSR